MGGFVQICQHNREAVYQLVLMRI